MPQYPTSPRETVLDFAIDHQDVWSANQAALGLTAAQNTAFKTANEACSAAFEAQRKAKQTAETATQAANDAYRTMKLQLATMVRTIKTFAENGSNAAAVYNLAEIPAPAAPSPVPPPARPTDVQVSLNPSNGALVLTWKAENPANGGGTSYIVRRKLPGETEFSFLGVSGKKTYTDNTFIAGPDSVQYTIQGQRSDSAGPISAVFTVTFGRAVAGQINVQSVKIAA